MAASRCSACSINWPNSGYQRCPKCNATTNYMSAEDPLAHDEADALRKQIVFDQFYEKRGEKPVETDPVYDEMIAQAREIAGLPEVAAAGTL